MDKRKFIKTVFSLSVISFISKLIGLIRESLLASKYGLSGIVDAYKVAYSIPDVLIFVLVVSISHVFIPIYLNVKETKSKEETDKFVSNIYNIGFLITIALTCILYLFLEIIIDIIAPGLSNEAKYYAMRFSRFIIPSAVFLVFSYIASSYLQANSHYQITSLIWIPHNILIIAGIILSKYNYDWLGIFTFFAISSMFLVQIKMLKSTGFKWYSYTNFRDPYIKKMYKLVPPVIISSAFNQMYSIIVKVVASNLGEGNISSIDYATRVNNLIYNIIVLGFISVSFVELSNSAKDNQKFNKVLRELMFFINIIIYPIIALIILLRIPIISIIYQRGAFTYENTLLTSQLLVGLAISVLGMSYRALFNKAFYSIENMKTPMIIGLITVSFNIVSSIILSKLFGVVGIAISVASSSIISMLLLMIALNKKKHYFNKQMLLTDFKLMISTIIMTLLLILITNILGINIYDNIGLYNHAINIVIVSFIGITIYVILLTIFKVNDITKIKNFLKRRNTNEKI